MDPAQAVTSAFGQELLGLEQILWLCAEHIEPTASQSLSERLAEGPSSVSSSVELLRLLENVIVTSLGLMAKVNVTLPFRTSLSLVLFILLCRNRFLLLLLLDFVILIVFVTLLLLLSRLLPLFLLMIIRLLLLLMLRLFVFFFPSSSFSTFNFFFFCF